MESVTIVSDSFSSASPNQIYIQYTHKKITVAENKKTVRKLVKIHRNCNESFGAYIHLYFRSAERNYACNEDMVVRINENRRIR